MKIIGKYLILGVNGEEPSPSKFFNQRVAIIDDYRGKIGFSIVNDLISFEDDSTVIIHNLHGYFRVIKDDISLEKYDVTAIPSNISFNNLPAHPLYIMIDDKSQRLK